PIRGQPMRVGQDGILPDELAAELADIDRDAFQVYLLAYPNFLPYEMFTRWVGLRRGGFRPEFVILGLTWRNVARDSALREQIYRAYRDPAFRSSMTEALERIPAENAEAL